MSRLHALVLLGWHFILHYLKKITFLYDPGGLDQFRENFDEEGLASLSEREREALTQWERCIGCGLCEAACSDLSVIPENRHAGPRFVAMAAMRDLSEAEEALPSAEALEECDCEELEQVCPVDIPIGDVAEFLERMARRRENAE
ncbi:MAG: hypothetical protein ABEN55_04780 [Bradymonadaceae bacterium]